MVVAPFVDLLRQTLVEKFPVAAIETPDSMASVHEESLITGRIPLR
jgi:hypothetical protein